MLYSDHPATRRLQSVALRSVFPDIVVAQSASINQTQATDELLPKVAAATRNKSLAGETSQKVTIITRKQIEQQLTITNDPSQVPSNLTPCYTPSRQKLNNTGETFRGRSALFLVDGVTQSNPLRDGGNDEVVGIAYHGEIQNSSSYDLLGKLGYWIDASLAYRLPVGRTIFSIENLTDEDYFTCYSQSFSRSLAVEDDLYFKVRTGRRPVLQGSRSHPTLSSRLLGRYECPC